MKRNSILYEIAPRRFLKGILGILVLIAAWGAFSTWREFQALREIRFAVENNGRQIVLIALQQRALASKIARLEREIRLLWGTPEAGTASWYGPGFHGRITASGELYDSAGATAAHPRLPMGTRVLIINLRNGLRAMARINDRGPFITGRIIDFSEGTAQRLAMIEDGLAEVLIIPITIAMATARPGIQD
jgi:rare lipoprotein A (peptidoglycan hydrolase)